MTKIIYPTLAGVAALVLVCFTLLPKAHAVNPAPDGGYPGANTAEGGFALNSGGGTYSTAIGWLALYWSTVGANTATGAYALFSNTTGYGNTATGSGALKNNTTGGFTIQPALQGSNTANGASALQNNTTGYDNTANGRQALASNTTGVRNTATGEESLFSNTTGSSNTANGQQALQYNTTGNQNTAIDALYSNTIGFNNTAIDGLFSNTTGVANTADGYRALWGNTTGHLNVGIGANAGFSLTTGSGNVCIGLNVQGVAGESNTTRIGNVYSSVASGRAVYVNSDNKLGTLSSSRRYKEEIKPMDKASEAVLALKPVTFHYKKELDPGGAQQFGLVAEEVQKVSPDLVTRDEEGNPETVRYEAINAMLLNEFLKEHRKVEQLQKNFEATVATRQRQIKALGAIVQEQASQIQKVSAELAIAGPSAGGRGAGKSAPKIVLNNQ